MNQNETKEPQAGPPLTQTEEKYPFRGTQGPYYWEVNPQFKSMSLRARHGMGSIVLDPVRWGMQNAGLRFNVEGILEPAVELSRPIPGREHHKSWLLQIVHPDAQLLEASYDLLVACQAQQAADDHAESCEYCLPLGNCHKWWELNETATQLRITALERATQEPNEPT